MKKVLFLVIFEILMILIVIFSLNLYVFRDITISIKPIFVLLLLAYKQHKLLSIPPQFYAMLTAVVVFIAFQFVFVYQGIRKAVLDYRNKNKDTQGTSRFAFHKELKKAGLIMRKPQGLILGQSADAKAKSLELDKFAILKTSNLIADDSPYHTLVVGATGAGKFVGVIGPTLLCKGNLHKSMIIVDPKSESYRITAGFRSQSTDVYYFNPLDPNSCHLNPLDYVPRDSTAVIRIKNIAKALHPEKSKDNSYWDACPQQLLEMFVGHVILKGKAKSIPEITHLINEFPTYIQLFTHIRESYKGDDLIKDSEMYPIVELVLAHANRYLAMATGDNSDQLDTHFNALADDLSAYSTPEALRCLNYSDFPLNAICDGERPMTLYFCCDVDNLSTVMPMFRLIFSLVIRSLLHEEKHKYKLWLFLDEFSQLKKFDIVQEQITYVRSFGIRIMAFIQSTAQLKDLYGHDGADALLDNFQIKLYLKATNTDTGMYFEKLLGRKTVLQKKTSLSSNRRGVGVDGWTESTSEVGRSLLTADEILHLPNYEELIFHPSIYPYRGKKVQYYSDARFKNLMNKPVKMPQRKMDAPLLPEFTSDLKISPDLEKLVEEKATDIKDPDISVVTDDTSQEKIITEILNSLVTAAADTEVEELDVEVPDVDVSPEEIDAQEDLGKKAEEEDEDEFI